MATPVELALLLVMEEEVALIFRYRPLFLMPLTALLPVLMTALFSFSVCVLWS
jgi:hypothetical protein